jgi:hypothetical protein
MMATVLLIAGSHGDGAIAVAEDIEYEWELKEVKINPDGARTSFQGGTGDPEYFGESRFKGKSDTYIVNETSMTYASVDYDHDIEYHNVSYTASFDKPPSVMHPGKKVTLNASVSGGGTVHEGAGGSGIIFEYFSDNMNLGKEKSARTGSLEGFPPDQARAEFTVPMASGKDEVIIIEAVLWNCGACRVQWIYHSIEVGTADSSRDNDEEDGEEENDRWVLKDIQINPNEAKKKTSRQWGGMIGFPRMYRDYTVTVTEKDMLIRTREVASWAEKKEDWDIPWRLGVGVGYRYIKTRSAGYDQPPRTMIPGDTINLSAGVLAAASIESSSTIRPWDDIEVSFSYAGQGIELKGNAEASAELTETTGTGGEIPDSLDADHLFDGAGYWGRYDSEEGIMIGHNESALADHVRDSVKPSFVVPEVDEGATITITASIEDCPACIVSWIYEPGDDSPLVVGSGGRDFEDRELFAGTCEQMSRSLLPQLPYSPMPDMLREGYIGEIVVTSGDVAHDYCSGGINSSATGGNLIRAGDCIHTGDGSFARITLYDAMESGGGFTTIDIDENSSFCNDDFSVNYTQQWRQSNWELLKGKVREFGDALVTDAFTEGIFSVKAGTTTTGIRGSDVLISYDQDAERVVTYVHEGDAVVTSEIDEETAELGAGQQIGIKDGEFGRVESLSDPEWETLIVDIGLPEESVEAIEPDAATPDEETDSQGSTLPILIMIGVAAAVAITAPTLIKRNRGKKDSP